MPTSDNPPVKRLEAAKSAFPLGFLALLRIDSPDSVVAADVLTGYVPDASGQVNDLDFRDSCIGTLLRRDRVICRATVLCGAF